MTNVTITEHPDGGYNVLYNEDAMPTHQADGPFASIDAAKRSVDRYGHPAWSEPDADCGGDVVAIAEL